MSAYKTVCILSLGSLLALSLGFVVASEVRAGGIHDLHEGVPAAAMVDDDALARAEAFAGEYTFVGGQKERDGIDAAVETSVESLSPVIRGIGRKRLVESNQVPKLLKIAVTGDDVEILFDGDGYTAKLGDAPVQTKSSQGDKVKVSHRLRGNKLTESIEGGQGGRKNEFRLSSDGARLTVDVTVSSPQLPVAVEYRLTFKRK
jgi:hypothetical protein